MTRVVALLACVTLLGCPGGSGSASSRQDGGVQPGPGAGAGSQPGSDTAASRLCGAHLRWDMGCAALEPVPREEPYWGETTCLGGPWPHVQPAYLDAAVACFETLSCDESDDACTAAGLAALGIESEADVSGNDRYQQCQQLAAGCDVLSEDNCLAFVLYAPASADAAERCLALACEAIEACLVDPR